MHAKDMRVHRPLANPLHHPISDSADGQQGLGRTSRLVALTLLPLPLGAGPDMTYRHDRRRGYLKHMTLAGGRSCDGNWEREIETWGSGGDRRGYLNFKVGVATTVFYLRYLRRYRPRQPGTARLERP
jgi:hypothetical protein